MFLSSLFPVAFGLGVAYASPTTTAPLAPLITIAPLIPRDFNSYFVGYTMYSDGDIGTYSCPYSSGTSNTFTTLFSRYAGCGYDYSDIFTSCYSKSAIASDQTLSCLSYCVTNLIFTSVGDPSPTSLIGCARRSEGVNVLRVSKKDLPKETTAVVQIFVDLVTTTKVVTEISTQNPTKSAASSPATSQPSTSTPRKNKAPIIGGAVAGSLVFLGLIGAGAFFFLRKRRATASGAPYRGPDQAVAMSPTPALPQAPYSPPPSYGPNSAAPVFGSAEGKQAHVAEYRVPEMHGQSAPLAVAPMPVYNQNSPGVVNSNTDWRGGFT